MKSLPYYIISLFLFFTPNMYAQLITDNSDWRGYITLNNNTLPFLIHLSKNKETADISGTCESPQQTQQSYILHNITLSDTDAHFEFNAGYGNTIFAGLLHGDSIDGTYTQNRLSGDFQLIKYNSHTDTLKTKSHSSFYEEAVTIINDKITLAGTLSKPEDGVRHSVIILISANGAQDRDESVYGFKPFKILADELASNGYAVLRLDDRGTGLSKGKTVEASTTLELADDIKNAITFLHKRMDVNANNIALIGHGEGATIAAIIAVNDPTIKCIVALGPPAFKGGDIQLQLLDSAREPGLAPDIYVWHKKLLHYYFSHPSLIHPDDSLQFYITFLEAAQYHVLSRAEKIKYTDSANYVKYMSTVLRAQMFSRWYRFYKDFNPALIWKSVQCPVLSLYATKDKELTSSLNKTQLENSIHKKSILTIKFIDGANHLFEKAQTGLPSEYSKLTKDFVPGFTMVILDWLKTKMQ